MINQFKTKVIIKRISNKTNNIMVSRPTMLKKIACKPSGKSIFCELVIQGFIMSIKLITSLGLGVLEQENRCLKSWQKALPYPHPYH